MLRTTLKISHNGVLWFALESSDLRTQTDGRTVLEQVDAYISGLLTRREAQD